MMVPDGAASSNQVPQQAEVVGQPSTMAKVAVPTGATAGQQINFTMPNGQRVTTSLQEGVQPGTVLTVAVPSADAPAPPAPAMPVNSSDGLAQAREALLPAPVVNAAEADQRAATLKWLLYGGSFLVCCFCSLPVALCIWGALALDYFCKSSEDRARRPRSYAPACASAVTVSVIGVLCVCALLAVLIAAVMVAAMCATDGDKPDVCTDLQKFINNSDIHWHHGPGPHGHHWEPHHWHNKRMFLDKVLHRDHHPEGRVFHPGMPNVEDLAKTLDGEMDAVPQGPLGLGPAKEGFVF
mmetsp:Transcript_61383/g.97316  ORF Transcript_61383/g.97316 Transcript_61383/m.97316 type:complete len:296 (+) Transcript_61383:73-960(+)